MPTKYKKALGSRLIKEVVPTKVVKVYELAGNFAFILFSKDYNKQLELIL